MGDMKLLDLTFPTPEKNLAFDELLLERCEQDPQAEFLRFWEPRQYFVVLGISNRIQTEAHLSACRKKQIPVLRRFSGGGAVLQGPGCLNFSLAIRMNRSTQLKSIAGTNAWVLNRHRLALQSHLDRKIQLQGETDLTLEGLKFSGNAQRRKKQALLFHGTFLLHLNLDLIEELLPLPSRQPRYRQNRPHASFLTHLPISAGRIKAALRNSWGATHANGLPLASMDMLVQTRYGTTSWNHRT